MAVIGNYFAQIIRKNNDVLHHAPDSEINDERDYNEPCDFTSIDGNHT